MRVLREVFRTTNISSDRQLEVHTVDAFEGRELILVDDRSTLRSGYFPMLDRGIQQAGEVLPTSAFA